MERSTCDPHFPDDFYRELDKVLGLTVMGLKLLQESRLSQNKQHQLFPLLRRGNHASAKLWRRVLLPVIERYRGYDIPKFFRGDAAFAIPELYAFPQAEQFSYVIRLRADAVLEK